MKRFLPAAIVLPLLSSSCGFAQHPPPSDAAAIRAQVPVGTALDLATALRLAGAHNLDVQFARQKLIEAEGGYASERLKFFPTVSPGIGYRRHDGRTQETDGDLLDVSKQSYAPGIAITAELNLGEAIYQNLAAKQLAAVRAEGVETRRAESMLEAGLAYYDLAFANALEAAALESVRLSEEQEKQLNAAVDAGIALKGDVLRVSVQKERQRLIVRQSGELSAIASARLARALHLDPTVTLRTTGRSLTPISMVEVSPGNAKSLASRAATAHPSLREATALTAVAEKSRDAVVLGPRVPTLTAGAFVGGLVGGLGGGRGSDTGNFGAQSDVFIGLSWRFGAGGIFDKGRTQSAEAKLAQARISEQQAQEQLATLVAQAHAAALSARDRLATSLAVLDQAAEVEKLSRDRKQFGVGAVLEMIQAGNDLALSRQDHLRALADLNQAQLALALYTGKLGGSHK